MINSDIPITNSNTTNSVNNFRNITLKYSIKCVIMYLNLFFKLLSAPSSDRNKQPMQ